MDQKQSAQFQGVQQFTVHITIALSIYMPNDHTGVEEDTEGNVVWDDVSTDSNAAAKTADDQQEQRNDDDRPMTSKNRRANEVVFRHREQRWMYV